VATSPNAEVAQQPAAADTQRISFLDAGGNPSPRESARLAVIREFDDHGNVISLMTQRL
jgi:hypothetical protein